MPQKICWILFMYICSVIPMGMLDQAVNGEEPKHEHHYYDLHGNSLEQYDPIWDTLSDYYGSYLPHVLTVVYIEGESSRFSPEHNQVRLSVRTAFASTGKLILAHESSHIALYHVTAGASLLEQFRFIDEGQAQIIGALATDTFETYQQQALNTAAMQYHKGNVSFEKVQQWSSYYGKPGSENPFAYDVGASFNLFLRERYGQKALFQFFEDLGTTRDLSQTIRNLFHTSAEELENEWFQYLASVDITPNEALVPPRVVEMYPPHGAEHVPVDVKEIYVRFNTDMRTTDMCINTPCKDTGICYKHAYWKTKKILAVKVQGSLKPDYPYQLSLGVPHQKCVFTSVAGVDLPMTPWHFRTGSK
ncbi:MAG: hypothetical protein JSV88_16440 [Candidatus Aminicenantes bacterium]|nr:MAG: hypothetical protein JSV88_16440 [Candidatus Aminicenantes bacterium]